MKINDHVRYEHKGRTSWGIVRRFSVGLYGEPRATVEWLTGDAGTPFPVCCYDLTPDDAGVVAGVLGARKNRGKP